MYVPGVPKDSATCKLRSINRPGTRLGTDTVDGQNPALPIIRNIPEFP